MKDRIPRWAWFAAAGVVIVALVAGVLIGRTLSGGDDGAPAPEPTGTVEPTGSIDPTTPLPADDGSADAAVDPAKPQFVRVYFPRDDKLGVTLRQIPPTKAVATAAMQALMLGPTGEEADFGLHSEIPLGTQLRGVSIAGGTATVDLSGRYQDGGGTLSMQMRLAQVVFTLTQFSTVDRVVFRLDGAPVTVFSGEGIMLDEPQTRAGYEDVLPAIFVEEPTPGANVSSPMRIRGTANTFEATFILNITDPEGLIIVEQFATATSGSGTRGTFDLSIPFTTPRTGMGALIVWEESAADGSRINLVEIPVRMAP